MANDITNDITGATSTDSVITSNHEPSPMGGVLTRTVLGMGHVHNQLLVCEINQ